MRRLALSIAVLSLLVAAPAHAQSEWRSRMVLLGSCPAADSLVGSGPKYEFRAGRRITGDSAYLALPHLEKGRLHQFGALVTYGAAGPLAAQDFEGQLILIFRGRGIQQQLATPEARALALTLDDTLHLDFGRGLAGRTVGTTRLQPVSYLLTPASLLAIARARRLRATLGGEPLAIPGQTHERLAGLYRALVCAPPPPPATEP